VVYDNLWRKGFEPTHLVEFQMVFKSKWPCQQGPKEIWSWSNRNYKKFHPQSSLLI